MIALFPFRYPMIVVTEHFGGMAGQIWILSTHALPSIDSAPFVLTEAPQEYPDLLA
jgi:hypothetical protein